MTNTVWFHSHEVLRVVRFIETENRMMIAGGMEVRVFFDEYKDSIARWEEFCGWMLVMATLYT